MLNKISIDHETAEAVIAAATAHAEKMGIPQNIAIVDEAGHLVAFRRMNGAKFFSIEIAITKAFAASGTRKATKEIGPATQPGMPGFGAQALRLSELPTCLHEYDAVISCTASTLPIIGLGAVERALKLRRHRPMFMVDLAVPRDIEPEVGTLGDVYLYTVDDLSALVQTAGEKRQAAVQQAEAIIDAGVLSFAHWLDQRAAVPLIQALNRQAEDWGAVALLRARKQLAKGESVDAVMEALARGLTHKMLHGALAELHAVDGPEREQLAHTVSRLFLRGNTRGSGGENR